jgi:hypothetical protein
MRVLPVRVQTGFGIGHATLMPAVLAALASLAVGCAKQSSGPTSAGPVQSRTTGRWTMPNTPISYHFWSDSAEIVMYPPQAPPPGSYQVVGDSVRVTDGKNTVMYAFAIRGDTLHFTPAGRASPPLSRIGGDPTLGIQGSWRARSATEVTVLTFRSDGALVMEVGVAPWPQRNGDTVSMRFETRVMRIAFHHANGRLVARGLDDGRMQSVTLVRRPWGCFGIPALDKKAKECD